MEFKDFIKYVCISQVFIIIASILFIIGGLNVFITFGIYFSLNAVITMMTVLGCVIHDVYLNNKG